jgi:predicted protein tyrosine phosphatase
MQEVHTNIYVGNDRDCFYDEREGWAVVHACKNPCHAHAVGYIGSLAPTHQYYLIYENQSHLFLNMVDMPQELAPRFTHPIIRQFLAFMQANTGRKILIHCNFGESRSPSLAMFYLAKIGVIPNNNYDEASNAFSTIYPLFNPNRGITLYLQHNWNELINI